MNSGVFYKEKEKLFLMVFEDYTGEIPFTKLKNGIASKEKSGYYTITKARQRMVNPMDLVVIQNGEILENPFSVSTNRMKDLFGLKEANFEPVHPCILEEPSYESFEMALIDAGFYRADKTFYFRAVRVENYGRRIQKTKKNEYKKAPN